MQAARIRYLAVAAAALAAVAAGAYLLLRDDQAQPDLSAIEVEPGRVSCDVFHVARGYRYASNVVLDLGDREEDVEPMGDPAQSNGFRLTTNIIGDMEGTDRLRANVYYVEQDVQQEYVQIGDTMYQSFEPGIWSVSDPAAGYRVPYTPLQACVAIAPDLYLDELEGMPEFINGLDTIRYDLVELEADLPERHPSFGLGSDAAVLVNTFSGGVWVASEGGYIAKMDLTGRGEYPNGRALELEVYYELFDVNHDIQVDPPI